jgi:hypothetical protein
MVFVRMFEARLESHLARNFDSAAPRSCRRALLLTIYVVDFTFEGKEWNWSFIVSLSLFSSVLGLVMRLGHTQSLRYRIWESRDQFTPG